MRCEVCNAVCSQRTEAVFTAATFWTLITLIPNMINHVHSKTPNTVTVSSFILLFHYSIKITQYSQRRRP